MSYRYNYNRGNSTMSNRRNSPWTRTTFPEGTLVVGPSKYDTTQAGKPNICYSCCGQRINKGDSISPHPNIDKVWVHTNCARQVLRGESFQKEEQAQDKPKKGKSKSEPKTSPKDDRGTITAYDAAVVVREFAGKDCTIPAKWKDVKLSNYQTEVIHKFLTTGSNIQLIAGPGCGKSFILKFLAWVGNVIGVYVCFNKAIKDEMASSGDLPDGLAAYTLHGIGRSGLDAGLGRRTKLDTGKLRRILWDIWPANNYTPKDEKKANRAKQALASKLVPHYKSQLMSTPEDGRVLMRRFNIPTNGADAYVEEVLSNIPGILERCKQGIREGVVDFDDMVWGPVVLGMPPKQRAVVLVDEAQDLSPCQLKLALATGGSTGRTICVGDKLQAIYGWRGASYTGMDDAYETLKAHPRGCIRLNLLRTYRCPSLHVELCNKLIQGYPQSDMLEANEGAISGHFVKVRSISEWLSTLPQHVIRRLINTCRTNAPLISAAMSCLKRGQKAIIRGRNFEQALYELVRKFHSHKGRTWKDDEPLDIIDFIRLLGSYVDEERKKAEARGLNVRDLEDRQMCLLTLSDGKKNTVELLQAIDDIFNGDDEDAVVFSTIHQVKGLEADYVSVLRPELMPGPWAETEAERREERNICWVAWSRSKYALVFEGKAPYLGLPMGAQWTESEDAIILDPFSPENTERKKKLEEAHKATEDYINGNITKGERDAVVNGDSPQTDIGPNDCEQCGKTVPEGHLSHNEELGIALCENCDQKALEAEKRASKPSLVIQCSTTVDTRSGSGRAPGANAVDIVPLGSNGKPCGKAPARTFRRLGWQYHVYDKVNKLIREHTVCFADNDKLPELPNIPKGRNAVPVTLEDWKAIQAAYEACGIKADIVVPEGWKQRALVLSIS